MNRFFVLFLFLISCTLYAQQPTVKFYQQTQPLSAYVIIIPSHPTPLESFAGKEFRKYLEKSLNFQIDILPDSIPQNPLEFVIGNCTKRLKPGWDNGIRADGFKIWSNEPHVFISGKTDLGTLYGVYDFFERFTGTRYLSPDEEVVPLNQALRISGLPITSNPAFSFREVYYAGMADTTFLRKMKCDRHALPGEKNWGMWVHTMFTLVPPDQYFASHPEYYALMAGKREKTQLCLTNPDVLKITIENLGKKMQQNPHATYWSVSQMDTYGSCECDKCKAIDKREGSPSGSIIEFVNKVAQAFPDKVISTLAYQYSRKAPSTVKPASNVNIMLCTIECDRGKPIASDTSVGSFYYDLKQWSRITSNILVWDYVIQFTNMIAPFPNLQVLQPNIQLFKKFNVEAVFEQGCHGTYSENQELRQYLLAKLLWNPYVNVDTLKENFFAGYYGNAGKWIRKYNKALEDAQIASGKQLWIYSSPVEEVSSFLGVDQLAVYDDLFGKAEYSVTLDPVCLNRVKMARLPLRYAKLEIARKNITGPEGFMVEQNGNWSASSTFLEQLDLFVNQANQYGVKSIHERGLSPDNYRKEVLSACSTAFTNHLARNKPYTLKSEPSPKYSADGPGSLTDGKRGFSNYHILWQGFEGSNFEMVVDLEQPMEVNYLGVEFLQDITSWIFMPEFVEFYTSIDGKKFTKYEKIGHEVPERELIPQIHLFEQTIPTAEVRYVKVFAKSMLKCPDWHIDHGGKAWLFVDEVIVQKRQLP